jgi:hypothetical protein
MGEAYTPEPGTPFARALELFEEIGQEIYDDGIWTCNGGAAAFSYICGELGVPHDLQVGLYYWDEDLESLNKKHLLLEGVTLTDAGFEPEDYWNDEHHHWVRVYTGDNFSASVIVDPNGEIRGEPRVQPYVKATAYQAKDDPEHFLVYDPEDPIEDIAKYDKDVARAIVLVDERLARPQLDHAAPAPAVATPAPELEI